MIKCFHHSIQKKVSDSRNEDVSYFNRVYININLYLNILLSIKKYKIVEL